jgi:preprotein translocase subunit SecY
LRVLTFEILLFNALTDKLIGLPDFIVKAVGKFVEMLGAPSILIAVVVALDELEQPLAEVVRFTLYDPIPN